jgi:hypothetical protein
MNMLRQLSAMLSRVGDVGAAPGNTNDMSGADGSISPVCRPEVAMVAKNISDLTAVVASPENLKMFFEYKVTQPSVRTDVDYYQDNSSHATNATTTANTVQAEEEAGLLAHLLVSCASTLVLQTPTYAALTLALHEASKHAHQGEHAGFAARCVTYAMQCFSRDLDMLLLDSSIVSKQQMQQQQDPSHVGKITQVQRAKTACRLKLLLRYFCLLGRLNIIPPWQEQDHTSSSDSTQKLTLLGLFKLLVSMATQLVTAVDELKGDSILHTNSTNTAAAYILTSLVLSNIPYLMACDIPMSFITQYLLQPLESLTTKYQQASPFTPGLGSTAILLKDEPWDEVDGDDEEDDEDDDDDDDGQQQPQPVCDSLQEMWRTVQNFVKQQSESSSENNVGASSNTKFALLCDDPWNHVRISVGNGDDADPQNNELEPVAFVELPIYLVLAPDCRSIRLVLQPRSESNDATQQQLCQHLTLDGIIFGRLPIFGSPSSPDDDDDDDMEDSSPSKPQQPESLQAYQREFGWNDRCLVAEAVRDIVLSYESTVSASGIERGTAKDVAEQIWSLQQAWNQESDSVTQKKGLEYAIMESLISLIVQTPVLDQAVVRQVYVSRVLLELTRQQPTAVPQALVMAVSNLFQDYMPSLALYARDNLCRWLAFHLTNTEYQWPAAYWRLWTSYVVADSDDDSAPKSNSRSQFVQRVLVVMSSNVHDLQRLAQESLPPNCELSRYLLPYATLTGSSATDSSLSTLEQDLQDRIWKKTEDADSLGDFLVGGEVAETVASNLGHDSGDDWRRTWWRTLVIVRALLHPAAQEHIRLKSFVEKALEQQDTNEDMEGGDGNTADQGNDDMVAQLLETLPRYRSVILAALTKDGEGLAEQQSLGGIDTMSERHITDFGEACLLQTVQSVAFYSRTVLETVVECLLQHKVVSAMAVLRWVLADFGRDDGESSSIKVVERWWELASIATRVSCAEKVASKGGSEMLGDGIGMIVDATGDGTQTVDNSPAKLLLDELGPLLEYSVHRVHTLLTKQDGHRKKLTAYHIQLIEGVKYFVRSAHSLFYESQYDVDDNIGTNSGSEQLVVRLEEMLTNSDVSGTKLASLCAQLGSGLASTHLLGSIMERI